MRALLAIALVLLLAAIGSIALVYFGSYNVAASDPHWNLTQHILDAVKTRAIKAHASGITVPADLDKPDLEGSFPSGGFRCFRCGLICRLAFFPRSFSNLALGDPGVARRDDRFSLLPSLGSFRAFGKILRALQLGLPCLVGCAEAVTEVRGFRSVHLRTALYPSSLSFTL